jgi:hypothetical protein
MFGTAESHKGLVGGAAEWGTTAILFSVKKQNIWSWVGWHVIRNCASPECTTCMQVFSWHLSPPSTSLYALGSLCITVDSHIGLEEWTPCEESMLIKSTSPEHNNGDGLNVLKMNVLHRHILVHNALYFYNVLFHVLSCHMFCRIL